MMYFVTWLAAFVAVGTFNAIITFVLFTPIATAVETELEGLRAMETEVPIVLSSGVVVVGAGVVVVGAGVVVVVS